MAIYHMLLGVDPGARTGMCLMQCGKIIHVSTVFAKDAISEVKRLHTMYPFYRAAVEMPRMGVLYKRHTLSGGILSLAGQIKIAQNVGQNIALTNMIIDTLRDLGVYVAKVHPKPGASKWESGYWCRVFKWEGLQVPGEHGRDATVIAYLNENRPDFVLNAPKEGPEIMYPALVGGHKRASRGKEDLCKEVKRTRYTAVPPSAR